MNYAQMIDLRQYLVAYNFKRRLHRRLHVGCQWRKTAWKDIEDGLILHGQGMRDAGAVDTACYVLVLEQAVEYLRQKPNIERVNELHRIVRQDLSKFDTFGVSFTPYMSEQERRLIEKAKSVCMQALVRIECVYPDTT